MTQLPFQINHVSVPPIKCQGIKTKLVPFVFSNVCWSESKDSRWVEPFLGSGVMAFNLAPQSALLADTNRHIIEFYQAIQHGAVNRTVVTEFLTLEGQKLAKNGAAYYYEVRQRFNQSNAPLDFLFLNRSCFNGVMRFNRSGEFNVPFGHKPARFSQAYITKIANQVGWVAKQMQGKNWTFQVADWQQTLSQVKACDFVYLDPPYIARHTDYYNGWSETDAINLAAISKSLPCGYALSMWQENKYRKNTHIESCWSALEKREFRHFYYVGSSEDYRNEMHEALLIKPNFATATTPIIEEAALPVYAQLSF